MKRPTGPHLLLLVLLGLAGACNDPDAGARYYHCDAAATIGANEGAASDKNAAGFPRLSEMASSIYRIDDSGRYRAWIASLHQPPGRMGTIRTLTHEGTFVVGAKITEGNNVREKITFHQTRERHDDNSPGYGRDSKDLGEQGWKQAERTRTGALERDILVVEETGPGGKPVRVVFKLSAR